MEPIQLKLQCLQGRAGLMFALIVLGMGSVLVMGSTEALAQSQVTVTPGQSLSQLAASHPAGTIFNLQPGVYRGQRVQPKDNQQFIGRAGVVLNGSRVLTSWQYQNGYWTHGGLPAPLYNPGFEGEEWHKWREDLFLNNKLYRRVFSLGEVTSGRWYFDVNTRTAYLKDDPRNQLVELGVTEAAFDGYGKGVVVRDMVVEKYASRGQTGAFDLQNTQDWKVINVRAEWNHGVGLRLGTRTLVQGGAYNNNGGLGIGGGQGYIGGHGSIIDGVEVAYNNYAGFARFWEAGGIKILHTNGVTIRNSRVHHNLGQGIWFDWENTGVHIHNNHIYENEGLGIQYEASGSAVIEKNFLQKNATNTRDVWFWGAAVLIQNSQSVRVSDNVVVVDYGDGIGMTYQSRGSNKLGPLVTINNSILRNKIIYLRDKGREDPAVSGNSADFDHQRLYNGNNVSDYNQYVAPDTNTYHWSWNDKQWISRDYLSSRGSFEPNGKFTFTSNPAAYAPATYQEAFGVPLGGGASQPAPAPAPAPSPTPTPAPAPSATPAPAPSTGGLSVTLLGVSEGSTLKANEYVNLQAQVTQGSAAIRKVSYYRSGMLQCTQFAAPYACSIKMWGAGDQVLDAVVEDANGNTAKHTVRFKTSWNVSAPAPTPAPAPAPTPTPAPATLSVDLLGVSEGSTLKANEYVNLQAQVTHGSAAIRKVSYYRSGMLQCTQFTAPFACSIKIWGAGDQVLDAVVEDANGNTAKDTVRFKTAW